MSSPEEKRDAITLYRHADDKIERTRNEVSNLLQEVLKLTMKTDRLTDRIDNGVAVTGQKTLEKVSNLVSEIASYTTKFAGSIDNHNTRIANVEERVSDLVKGVFWIAIVGIGGSLIALGFIAIKNFGVIFK